MATHSFPVLTHFILICWWFSAWKTLNDATNSSYHIHMLAGSCIPGIISKYQNGMPNMARTAFNIGRSWTQYVARLTKLLSSYCGAHLVQSYCQELNISDTNLLRYLSSLYLIKTQLSIWCQWCHISKTWISLEPKEIFENSKKHFSSYTDYFFML